MRMKLVSSLLLRDYGLDRFSYKINQIVFYATQTSLAQALASSSSDDYPYADVPKPCRTKSERKPYLTPMKLLIQKAKGERLARKIQPCRMLEEPPDNGLLVPELVDVAHQVYKAWKSLHFGVSKLIKAIPVQRCSYCSEVHIGHVGHEIRTCTGPSSGFRNGTHVWRLGGVKDVIFFPKCYHLLDRVGKPRVGHKERFDVPKLPAILELCIQAGLDLDKYRTKRRNKPVYSMEGRIVDFEEATQTNEVETNQLRESNGGVKIEGTIKASCFGYDRSVFEQLNCEDGNDLRKLSVLTLESWLEMVSGAEKLMVRYSVLTCGYCPEVQVGPKGHKVRMCKASKHQSRNGMHAWQEAKVDDLVGPNYVWHVSDPKGTALENNLKRYYGKAPAVVELCVQGGAPVPGEYKSMMRLDVVPPGCDEFDLVA